MMSNEELNEGVGGSNIQQTLSLEAMLQLCDKPKIAHPVNQHISRLFAFSIKGHFEIKRQLTSLITLASIGTAAGKLDLAALFHFKFENNVSLTWPIFQK